MGGPSPGDPITHSCFCKPLSLPQSHSPFFWNSPSSLCVFFPELPTLTSQSILLYIAWDEWRCHDYSLTRVNGGLIPSFLSGHSIGEVVMVLELIPTSKGPLGSDILEDTKGQPSIGYLRAVIPLTRLKMTKRGLLWVFKTVQSHLSSWALIGPWGTRIEAIGPKWGWGDGLGCQARSLGPMGLRPWRPYNAQWACIGFFFFFYKF